MELLPRHETPGEQMTGLTNEPTPDEICTVLARKLRTPLSTIEGYLDLIAHGGVGAVTDEQREFLEVVTRNVQRLTVVVSDWYDLARLEAGRYHLTEEPVDLLDVADTAVGELRARIRAKQQQIKVDAPADPIVVRGDARALTRIIANLLSNAHKYSPPGGKIRLSLSIESADRVRLDVQDTGIGIRDEDQAYLFRKFFRAPLTESEPGTGLGLTLVKALVERMHGRIIVRSTLGEGSTFTIVLPRAVEVRLPQACQPAWSDDADASRLAG